MIYPAPDKLDTSGSKYALVIVAAKRARQIREGARRLVDSKSPNPLTVALEELAAGEIIPLQVGEPERLPESLPATPVLGGLVSSGLTDSPGKVTKADIYAKLTGGADDEESEDVMADEDAVSLDDLDEEEDEEEELEDEADVLTLVDPDGEFETAPAVGDPADPDAVIFKDSTDDV
jgi:DNA-directed RNA polymerase subunit omega